MTIHKARVNHGGIYKMMFGRQKKKETWLHNKQSILKQNNKKIYINRALDTIKTKNNWLSKLLLAMNNKSEKNN